MKKKALILMAFFLVATHLPAVYADQSQGWSGRIDLGVQWMRDKNHLEADDDNKRISSLNADPKSLTEIVPAVNFQLAYGFENVTIYAGIPYEDEPRPTLGIIYDMPRGPEIDFSLFYGMPQEVWEDPYLVGVDRRETDEDNYGFALAVELADWQIKYELESVNIDKDEAGKRLPDLKRNGMVHTIETGYEFEFPGGLELVPFVAFSLGDMDGKSQEFKGYGGGLDLIKSFNDVVLQLSAQAEVNDYDGRHPVFEETREDKILEVMAILTWLDPFGYENFSLSLGAGYERANSNIDFYDSSQMLSFFGIGYRFGAGEGHND